MPAQQRQRSSEKKRKGRLHRQVIVGGLVTLICTASCAIARPITAREGLAKVSHDIAPTSPLPASKSRRSAENEDSDDTLALGRDGSVKSTRGLDYQMGNFDSHFVGHDESNSGSVNLKGEEKDVYDRQHQWEAIQAEWEAGWESTAIDSDSRGGSNSKGKGRAVDRPFSYEHESNLYTKAKVQRIKTKNVDQQLTWTRQRAPFHASEVGRLATQSPHSIGIFKPEYPFTPSGRRRSVGQSVPARQSDLLLRSPFNSGHTLPKAISHGNVLKHGWSESVLDDDVKLSVPDEMRRSRDFRSNSKLLWGKKWFRWKPGEGYVLSRKKDLSAYRHGPGIALGQLLPPKERPFTASLPLIPNDSKRDFVWLIAMSIAFFTLVACIQEYRGHLKSDRKGKRRNRSSTSLDTSAPNLTGLRLQRARTTSLNTSMKPRQRMRAQNFRDLCKGALLKGVNGMGIAASTTTTGLANVRWSNNSNNGISSGYNTSKAATKRSSSSQHNHDKDVDEGATIEMLENGGADGSNVVSPVLDKSHSAFLTTVSTTVFEDDRYHNWNTVDQIQQAGQSSESSSSATSSSSNPHNFKLRAKSSR